MREPEVTWCVAYTQPFKERLAQQHLLEQGYKVYLPQFKKTRRHARRVEEVLAPLFPRYIFIGIDLKSSQWRSINGTRGISHLLMSDSTNPASVPLGVIKELRTQEISEAVVPASSLISFIRGERIRILEGIFKDHVAFYEALDDKSRVQLLLNFLGREMKASFPIYAVEAA